MGMEVEIRGLLHIARAFISSNSEAEAERLLMDIIPMSRFRGKVYTVGGFTRDQLLGIESKDLDVVVEEDGGSKKITRYIHNMFPKETSAPRQLGSAYPIWQINFKRDIEFNGKTYGTLGAEVQFADTQKESYPDDKSRQRVVEYGTLDEDIKRRDFTANMLLRDLTTGELKDLTGKSINDIKRGILRGHPGVDFDEIMRQDPIRLLRLVRFQAKYGWRVPLDVIKTVKKNSARIKTVSGERIRDELVKVMKVGKLAQAIRFMKTLGLLRYVMPEVEAMSGTEQEYSRGSHQEGDVFKHTMLVLRSAKPGVVNQLAALLHDVGKPDTQEVMGGVIRFLGHEKVSGEIAEAIMRRLKFERKDIKAVRKMVEMHMRPHHFVRQDAGPRALRRFVREVGEELVDAVLDLAEADSLGNLPSENEIPRLRQMIREVQNVPVEEKPPLDGNEIQKVLGIGPGPEVGRAVQFLRDRMDELAGAGRKMTKSEAIRLLREEYE